LSVAFAGQALDVWAYQPGLRLHFIEPGKPVQNAFNESFSGMMRVECLDARWFATLSEANQVIEAWRRESNENHPHWALGERMPNEFAGQCAASRARTSLQALENSLCE
jgi:putative transposase